MQKRRLTYIELMKGSESMSPQSCPTHEAIEIRISHLEKDMEELKIEVKESLKEIKEDNKIISEAVAVMKENIVKLTVIQENQSKNADLFREELGQLRQKIDTFEIPQQTDTDEEKTWQKKIIEKLLYFIGFIVAAMLGANVNGITELFKN